MDPALRTLLDHSKLHQGAAREVAALLPPGDDALAALLGETCTSADPLGFLLVVSTALDAGRAVDAACLRRGLGFGLDTARLGCLAWKMTGDVPGAILAALTEGRVNHELHAGALFVVAAWCAERRGGELPAGFAADARTLARTKNLSSKTLIHLQAAAVYSKDEGVMTVVRQQALAGVWDATLPHTEKFARALLNIFVAPASALIPDEPPRAIVYRQPIQRAVEKLGRNDPCHCGSGRKHKRCCFEKDRERLQFSSEVAGLTQAELRAVPETALTEGRLKAMQPLELARLDPRKIPPGLLTTYMMQCAGLMLFERLAECFEVLEWSDDDHSLEQLRLAADFVSFFVVRDQRQDIAARLLAAPPIVRLDPPYEPRDSIRLLLARDDPAAELRVLDEIAAKTLRETVPDKLITLGYGLLCSRHTELGLLVCRALAVLLPRKDAAFLLERILEARDKLDLPPDDPFSDLLEKRLAEETSDEGKDAAALRAARQRLDAKAAEVRVLKEEIDDQRRRLDRQEKAKASPPPSASLASVVPRTPEEDAALREMRAKLAALKGTLGERAAERVTLRHELEKARDDLEALRQGSAATALSSEEGPAEEAAFYLPEQPAGNQPLRLVEFPPRFRETLDELPRQAARGALAMLGRLAGGEPAAFVGVVQLKACHGILRQRIGSEHRLLFRLLPDRVQVVDFINRRDLDRRIKTLRAAG